MTLLEANFTFPVAVAAVTEQVTWASVDCEDPGEVAGATKAVTGEAWRVGTSIIYGCQENYQHSHGNLTRECLPGATWSGDPPSCAYVGAMVSAETLLAVTGALAVLVLILLPVEFLRYKVKQARGREMMKSNKSARKMNNLRVNAAVRGNPFMGTPVFGRGPNGPNVHQYTHNSQQEALTSSIGLKVTTQPNYASNRQTLPRHLPKLMDNNHIVTKESHKKLRKKRIKKNGPNGRVGPMSTRRADDSDVSKLAPNCDDENVAVNTDSHSMKELGNGPTNTTNPPVDPTGDVGAEIMPPSPQYKNHHKLNNPQNVYYDNQVTLEDEMESTRRRSADQLQFKPLPPPRRFSVTTDPGLERQNYIDLEGRDTRDFVV